MTNCSIDNCTHKKLARGFCNKHYLRWKNHGDPNKTNRTGVTKLPEYQIWASMKDRCNNSNSQGYSKYGGRGIKICERWLESFNNFLEDMELRPSTQHSIDRIDNDGNYEPSNCRWATKRTQSLNQRRRKDNTSGFLGVCKNYKKWSPYVSFDGKTYGCFGSYSTVEEAAYVRDQVVMQLHVENAITNYIY